MNTCNLQIWYSVSSFLQNVFVLSKQKKLSNKKQVNRRPKKKQKKKTSQSHLTRLEYLKAYKETQICNIVENTPINS